MKSYLLYGLIATILFAASATVSLYYVPSKPAAPENPKAAASKTTEPIPKLAEPDPAEKLKALVKSGTPDPDQTALLLQTLRDREKAVREKEDQLAQRRKNMEEIYKDIRGERAVLDDLRKQLTEELKELNKKLAEMDKRSTELDQQKQKVNREVTDLQQRQIDLESTERKNIDKLARVYENMAPENAARIVQQMADGGRMETAVKLLSLMKERQAAGILELISDAGLAAQLTEKLRGLKRATTTGLTTPVSAPAPKALTPG